VILTISIYFNIAIATLIYCFTAVIPLGCALIALLLRGHPTANFIRIVIHYYGRLITQVAVWPFIRLSYRDTASNECGAGVYICNHRSASDPFFAWVFGQKIVQIVNGWPMRLVFFGFFARQGEYLDVTQLSYEQAKHKISQLISAGVSVVAFPEGTRSGKREMNKFHSMIFRVSHELKLRIYPCCILGNEQIPDRNFLFTAGHVTVYKLPKVETVDYADKNPYCLKEAVWHLIGDAINTYEN
jgi:1-acyl-sn-glycerol-3-phosphate acyltransferase